MGMRRDRGLEGLRGAACLTVVVAHLVLLYTVIDGRAASTVDAIIGEGLLAANHALTFFFALSGYLLYKPFATYLLGGPRRPSIRAFYRNRVLRVFPGYWVILAVAGFVLGATVVETSQQSAGETYQTEAIGYLTNPLQLFTDFTLLHGYTTEVPRGIPPSWSLVPELAFYAILPLLFLAVLPLLASGRRSTKQDSLMAALLPGLLLVVVGLIGYEVAHHLLVADAQGIHVETGPSRLYHSFVAVCSAFGYGMIAAVVVARLGQAPDPVAVRRVRRVCVALVVFGVVTYLPARVLGQDLVVMAPAMAALMPYTVLPHRGRLAGLWLKVAEWKPLDRAGTISLSLYLWHYPVMLFLAKHFPDLRYTSLGGFLVAALATLPLCWVLSEVTYRFVEMPALARKKAVVPTSETAVHATTRA
ncbi:acyltransferase [Nocardioides sp.]|uniref:acyltransferase family protein n=1 Tax=Nocardioides sp. TaxID=35761 RepID=UPI002BDA9F8C|nr:acyltransferase [Nocardioides sp.]HSX66779.1 acyltransferase [Nocardioides sp.]